ncbi:hypothetical protein ACFLRC_05125 [Candidatus Altiarchaeota archaeon]
MNRFHKRIACTLILLLVSQFIAAQETSLALDYYRTAEAHYASQEYQDAILYALEAKELYEDENDAEGVARCEALLSGISAQLTRNREAGMYYDIAVDPYYLGGDYVKAISRAELALDIYRELNNSGGEEKALDLIDGANNELSKIQGALKDKADIALRMAKDFYLKENWVNARAYAENASLWFSQAPYQPGKDMADELLASIDANILEIKQNADVLYDRANDLFVAEDLDGAEPLAAKSMEYYTKINYVPGMEKAERLQRRIITERGHTVDEKLKKADLFFQDAENYFIKGDCQNATYWVVEAREIYLGLYRDASALVNQKQREALHEKYQELINNCNRLLGQIQAECGREIILEQAEIAYQEAQKNYLLHDYRMATTYAQKARGLCSQIEDYVCISKVETLLNQINERVQKKQEADSLFEEAQVLNNQADYQTAMLKAEEALVIYKEIWHSNLTGEVEAFKEEIYKGMEKLEEAERLYDQAQNYYETQDFENSVKYGIQARDIYVEINLSMGIAASNNLVSESQSILDERARQQRNQMLFIGGIILVGGVVIFFIWYKRREIEEEAEIRREEDRRVKIREEEEWEITKQEETEKRVKDELESILKREREELSKEE